MAWWSTDSRRVYFVDVGRGAKAVRVVELDSHTGRTRDLFEETSDTFVRLAYSTLNEFPLFVPLPESDELIWFSERTGCGHLYLFDLIAGELRHPITEGDWLVRDVLHYDAHLRELLIQTAGRDKAVSPYYRDICKVNIDNGCLTPLVEGNFDFFTHFPESFNVMVYHLTAHRNTNISSVSPCGQYIIATRSRVDMVPVSMLLDREGNEMISLEMADITSLPADWQWPEPVKLKAADQVTDIYGVVFRPPGFTPDQSYPVVDFSCGIRNHSCVPHGSFANSHVFGMFYLWGAALAALGFIVVAVEGRGTPHRDKAFFEHNYGSPASDGEVADRIAAIQQLAELYPYMDLDRVGISSGDNVGSAVYGMLNYPDFYKVAVVNCFTDPRFHFAAVGESFEGIPFEEQAGPQVTYAEDLVESLKGKLLLVHGMLDPLTPTSTFRLVNALQNANKDFDMLCLPQIGHDVPAYAMRRNWDYLVTHLLNAEPPHEFFLTVGQEIARDSMVDKN